MFTLVPLLCYNSLMLKEFYAGKRVVVTGGAGFVGGYLVRRLIELGADVSVVDTGERGTSHVEGARYASFQRSDVSNGYLCEKAFENHEVVFNLAAEVAGVLHNESHHSEMYHANSRVQTVPLAVAEYLGIEHFLQVSTVCVYAPEHLDPAQEANGSLSYPHKANWGYAWAKRMGERMLEISSIPHAVIVRPSNIYGPGDYFDDKAHVIPALIKRAYHDGPLEVFGDPNIKREFLYVEDAAEAMIHAMWRGENKEAYNAGTDGDTQVTLSTLVGMILDITGNLNKEVIFNKNKGGGDPVRRSDGTKMRDVTGWEYSVGLREGLERTVAWYETTRNNE